MQFRHMIPVIVLGLCCAWPALSQDKNSGPNRAIAAAQKEKAVKAEKKPSPRLPNNYGKLDLSDAQKDQIYTAQAKYNGQIDALEEQIKSLKEKRDDEIEAVLTAAQKQKLKALQSETKRKKDDKETGEKPKAEDKN